MTGRRHSNRNAAANGATPSPTRAVVVRRPRTSLIDAEWEWLARRFDDDALYDGDHGSAQMHSATWPPPPFSPESSAAGEEPERSSPVELVGPELPPLWVVAVARSGWGLLATALLCFVAGAYSARSAAALLAPQEMPSLAFGPVSGTCPTQTETRSVSQALAAAPNALLPEPSPVPSRAKRSHSKPKVKLTAFTRRVTKASMSFGQKRPPASLQASDNPY